MRQVYSLRCCSAFHNFFVVEQAKLKFNGEWVGPWVQVGSWGIDPNPVGRVDLIRYHAICWIPVCCAINAGARSVGRCRLSAPSGLL